MELINNNQVPEGYKKTEVGVIPEDWDVDRIASLTSISTGSRNTQDRVNDGQYPFFVRSQIVERINSYSFDGEAVLTAGDGVGTGKVFHYINGKFDIHQRVYKISNFKSELNGLYFYKYFSNHFYDRIMSMTAKSSVDSVRMEMIANMLIPLPSPKEQKAIAQTLSDVDVLIAALDKLIAKKRNIKTGTMQQLLTGKTRLPGFGEGKGYKKTEVGVIPEDWEVKQIHQIIEVDPENLTSKTDPDYEFKYISLEDVDNGCLCNYSNQIFSQAPSRARRILRYQDILFATVRPNLKSHLFFDKNESDWICSTGFAVLRCKENQSASGFIFAYLFSRAITAQIEALISGSNYPAINSNDVKNLEILLPPLPEQKAIAQILSDIDSEIAALEKRRAKTQAIKQGMMQELLTGRTRLKFEHPDDPITKNSNG